MGALFGPRAPLQGVHKPAKANSGRSSPSANHVGVLRGFVSAYSQNDVAGTSHGSLAESQPRSAGCDVADVGDRLAAKLQWSRHAPARYNQFTLTIRTDA